MENKNSYPVINETLHVLPGQNTAPGPCYKSPHI